MAPPAEAGDLRIQVRSGTQQPLTVRIGARPLYVGRAPTNDLVLDDEQVSGRHCAISATAGRAFVEDLTSRNGTWFGDRRVRRMEPWPRGQTLRVGTYELDLLDPAPGRRVLALLDVDSGLLIPIRERLRIGGDAGADLSVEGAAEAVLIVDPDGEAWMGSEDGSLEPLEVDREFTVGRRRFRLAQTADGVGATAEATSHPWPYALRVEMNGPLGPVAIVEDGERQVTWTAENRVVLWWILGRRLSEDRSGRGLSGEEAGWVPEQEVATGVWGRDGLVSNLGVLVTRVRHDLRRGMLDPWFLERRRGHLRARLAQVDLK